MLETAKHDISVPNLKFFTSSEKPHLFWFWIRKKLFDKDDGKSWKTLL